MLQGWCAAETFIKEVYRFERRPSIETFLFNLKVLLKTLDLFCEYFYTGNATHSTLRSICRLSVSNLHDNCAEPAATILSVLQPM